MSGYLNNLVGYVLKYFKKDIRKPRKENSTVSGTPSRTPSCKKTAADSSPIKNEIWRTPETLLRREKSCPPVTLLKSPVLGIPPAVEPRRYYTHGEGDNCNQAPGKLLEHKWNLLRGEISDSLNDLGLPRKSLPRQRGSVTHNLKQSISFESIHSTPVFNNCRSAEWRRNYDKFLERPYPSEEDQSKRLHSKIPILSGRRVSLEDTRRLRHRSVSVGCCACKRTRPWTLHSTNHIIYDPVVRRLNFDEEKAARYTKSVIAHRSQLNVKLERMFRHVSQKKYCGNIIDVSSHVRWMKLAGIEEDEDGRNFKKSAKGRVVLTVSEYKSALQKLCDDHGLDYWNVLQKMTDVSITPGDANSLSSSCREDR